MSAPFDINSSSPHDDQRSEAQIACLTDLVGSGRVCDLGCGHGRLAIPLAQGGAHVVAVDYQEEAVHACGIADDSIQTVLGDMTSLPTALGLFDWVLCVGNTFGLLSDVDDAVSALQAWRGMLREGGAVVLDDLPGDFWPEVTSGRWANGLSEDASEQLVWNDRDAVLAFRCGHRVDSDHWSIQTDDVPIRIWTDGALRMAARLAGFSPPEVIPDGGILILRPAPNITSH